MSAKGKKQVCRDAWNAVFDLMGGIDALLVWGREHPSEFYKIFAKLAPPIKEDKNNNDTHDAFIKMIMDEEHKQLKEVNQPVKLIDVDYNIDDDSS